MLLDCFLNLAYKYLITFQISSFHLNCQSRTSSWRQWSRARNAMKKLGLHQAVNRKIKLD
jgi:hypothetical protein